MPTTPWSGWFAFVDAPDSPAVFISWDDAQLFITALNDHTGETFRMPTEAEWEYACRAGATTEYYFGDSASNLGDYAWYGIELTDAEELYAHIVGQKLPNAWGLYDMIGNAKEWCQDWYDASYYSSSTTRDPAGPLEGDRRVIRGADISWSADYCRSASRGSHEPDWVGDYDFAAGFRVVRVLPAR